jgi:adenine-specific DNA-methyltransferase
LGMPRIEFDGIHEVYNEDLNTLALKIEADVIYLDPPYNTRQYIDNYHVLENIITWKKPCLYGKTKKFQRDNLKSEYSSKIRAASAFEDLINKVRARHIFLSYNNEGIIQHDVILRILESHGEVAVFEKDYSIFGNGAGRSQKRPIIERLYHCKVQR